MSYCRQPRENDFVVGEVATLPAGNDTLTLEPNAAVLAGEQSAAVGGAEGGVGDFLHFVWSNKGATIGLILTMLLLFVAIFAPLVAPHDPMQQHPAARLAPPFFMDGWRPGYVLGTDAIGRDLLSRLIYGLRVSLLVSFSAVILSIIVGVLIGLFAGYFGGLLDAILMRI